MVWNNSEEKSVNQRRRARLEKLEEKNCIGIWNQNQIVDWIEHSAVRKNSVELFL